MRWTSGTRRCLLLLFYAELFQLGDDVLSGVLSARVLFDVEDLAVGPDVERPAAGVRRRIRLRGARRVDDSVGVGGGSRGIAEDDEVSLLFFGEGLVVFRRIHADHEIRDVEVPNQFPALTERVAFGCSSTGEGFGKPGEDDRLALQLRQRVR